MRHDQPPTPEEREQAIRMVYECVGRNGGPPWEQLDATARLVWYNYVDDLNSQAREMLDNAASDAREARPITELKGEADGALLVGGQSYLTKNGQLYGPQKRVLQ